MKSDKNIFMVSYTLLKLKINYKSDSNLIIQASLTTFDKDSRLISTSYSV